MKILSIVCGMLLTASVFAQQADTIDLTTTPDTSISLVNNGIELDTTALPKKKLHSPLKAVLFSAALPGLGQAYNKKYWKIPIVYAGLGVGAYFLYDQNKKYQGFRKAYQMEVDGNPLTDGKYVLNNRVYTSESNLEQAKNYYRRNVDLISALLVVWYGLNLVDAAVDAHLFDFDVSDDLSMQISPDFKQYQAFNKNSATFGVQLKLHF